MAQNSKRPSFQFYPNDWMSDLKLRRCSPAARGVWIDVLCAFHDSDDGYGLLRWPIKEIARTVGASKAHLQELVDKGVLRGSDKQLDEPLVYVPRSGRKSGPPVTLVPVQQGPLWYSKRLVTDDYVRSIRGESSRFGGRDDSQSAASAGDEFASDSPRDDLARAAVDAATDAAPCGTLVDAVDASPEGPSKQSPTDAPKPPFGDGSSTSSPTSLNTPIAPKGLHHLKVWLDYLKATGERPIPPGDPLLKYADDVGLSHELLTLAWKQFKHTYTGLRQRKRYRDWRAVFRNAVEGNWMKVWYLDARTGDYGLTTVGHQAMRAHDERNAE